MSKDLCEEMIVEIFLRLPPKSLLRFRSASKSLYSRIGSPDFIRLHALRSPKQFVCVHVMHYEQYLFSKTIYTLHSEAQLPHSSYTGITPTEYPYPLPEIFGSCNGILCLYEFKKGVALWNPSIRRKIDIHDPRSQDGLFAVYGFGFDPIIQDYKVVRITRPYSFVYTIKTRKWRKVAFSVVPKTGDPSFTLFYSETTHQPEKSCSDQCLFNGAMHRIESWGLKPSEYYHHILRFDFSSEVFSSIELPEPYWGTQGLGIIKGSLAVSSSKGDDYRIWVRRECNDTDTAGFWSVFFKLNPFPRNHRVDRFFQLTANDNVLLAIHYREPKVYNRETGREESKLADFSDSTQMFSIHMCDESLELLDMETSCHQISKKKVKPKKVK